MQKNMHEVKRIEVKESVVDVGKLTVRFVDPLGTLKSKCCL